MRRIKLHRVPECLCCLFLISESQISESHQIIAVRLVSLIQVIIKDHEIREGNCKVLNAHLVIQMALSVVEQTVISRFCLHRQTKFLFCKSLIVDHVGRLVIVVHHSCRFIRSDRSCLILFLRLIVLPEMLFCKSEIIMDVVILRSFQLSFPEVLRIYQRLPTDGTGAP